MTMEKKKLFSLDFSYLKNIKFFLYIYLTWINVARKIIRTNPKTCFEGGNLHSFDNFT